MEKEQGSTETGDRASKNLEGHVGIDLCRGVRKETPIIPTLAIAQGRPTEPTAVHRIHDQPTTRGETGSQVLIGAVKRSLKLGQVVWLHAVVRPAPGTTRNG